MTNLGVVKAAIDWCEFANTPGKDHHIATGTTLYRQKRPR